MQIWNPLTQKMEDEDAPTQSVVPKQSKMSVAPVMPSPAASAPIVSPVEQLQEEAISLPAAAPSQYIPTQYIPVETVKTSTKQVIVAPEEAKLEKERQDLLKNELENQNKSLVLEKEIALVKEERAKQDAIVKAEKQLKLDEQLKLDAENQAKDMVDIQTARDEAKNFKFQDYWADKSTGNKLLAAFSVGLGAFGGAISGSNQNYALDIVNKTIDRDYQMQRDKLEQLNKNTEGVVQGANMNRQVRADALARLDASFAGKLDNTAAMFEQKLLSFGVPAAEIANNKIINEIKGKANEAAQRAAEGKRSVRETEKINETKIIEGKVIEGQKPQQVTEGQAKARGFASRMVGALKIYDKEGGVSPEAVDAIRKYKQQNSILSESVIPGVGKVSQLMMKPGVSPLPDGISEKDKRAYLALEEFARANLRKESGAAIGVDEMQSELDQYLPSKEDDQTTRKQRRGVMSAKLAGLQQEIGQAKINIPKAPENISASSPSKESGMVSMIAPDGRQLLVPADRVKDMEAKGAKRK
jgi:hypothetical protein